MQVQVLDLSLGPQSETLLSFEQRRIVTEFPDAEARVFKGNFYVNNYLDSFDNENDASTIARDISQLLDWGGFSLTKWLSTSRRLLEGLPLDRRASSGLDFKTQRPSHREDVEAPLGRRKGYLVELVYSSRTESLVLFSSYQSDETSHNHTYQLTTITHN